MARGQTERLVPMVQELCAEKNVKQSSKLVLEENFNSC